jgi:regulator of sirC expression with transglutaminase-like and TPR domain
VSLGIIYLAVARACGWEAVGLSFPSHFLIRVGSGPAQAIIDPFHGGQTLTADKLRALRKSVAGSEAELAPDQFAAVEDVEVLMRLQNNIKSRLLQKRDGEGALAVLDSMLLVAPDRPELWYETGMINAAMEKNGAAIRALERCLSQAAGAGHGCGLGQGARSRAEETLHRLKRRLN